MEIVLLMGVVVLIGGMFIVGYTNGIIKILLSFAATAVAFVLALVLASPFELFIKNSTPLYDKIKNQMTGYVSEYVTDEMNSSSEEVQKDSIKDLKLPWAIQKELIENNTADEKLEMGVNTFSEYIATSLTDILVKAISILILFLCIKIILRIIIALLDIVSHLPILNGINKLLGGILGIIEGILIIWVICFALTAFTGTNLGEQILSTISSNEILNFIYSNNLILKLLMKG